MASDSDSRALIDMSSADAEADALEAAAEQAVEPLEASSPAEASQQVADAAVELRACQIERQATADSVDSGSAVGGSAASGGGGGSSSNLFNDQEEIESDMPRPPQAGAPDDSSASPSPRQLAALRSAQAAADAAAAAGGSPSADASEALLSRCPKHVFVFSTAGKPIFSYRGDEGQLAGLMATAEAILSVAHSKGHTLKHVRAGHHVFAFLERPPLCLVGVSALAEPPAVLRMQLTLVHGQIVSLLTSTALAAMFARNPGYDARKLLGGSEGMLATLIHSFAATPAVLLGAYPSLPLLGGVRQALLTALAAAVKTTNAMHGLVVAGGHVAAACPAAGMAPLQQWDVLLLLNLLGANESFRHSGEAMTPVCLPRFNSAANLHAYIHYADAATQTATVLLCGGMPDLSALSAAQQRMQQQLEGVGALQALVQSAAWEQGAVARQPRQQPQQGGSGIGGRRGPLLAVGSLPAAAGGGGFGATPLLHFIYKLSGRQQYVMSPFSDALVGSGLQQALIVAYSQLRASMFESSKGSNGPLQRLRFEARPCFVLLGSVSASTELYLACDALTDKQEAAALCTRLGIWLQSRHDQLFSF